MTQQIEAIASIRFTGSMGDLVQLHTTSIVNYAKRAPC